MEHDWLNGLIGGLMIGTAAALYLLVNGRIMGASGILGGLVDGTGRNTWTERLAFVIGLIALPALLHPLTTAQTHVSSSLWVLVPAGLLVGVGTRLAKGCTSGHGVCGLSRFAPRGFVATGVYLIAGGLTMAALRHIWGLI